MAHRCSSALGVAFMALALTCASAHAADTITVAPGADPTEEVPVPITVAWSSGDPSPTIHITVKPAGPRGCAPNYAADDPDSQDVVAGSNVAAAGKLTTSWTAADPGSLTLCGYLEHASYVDPFAASAALVSTGPVALDVRSATASVAIAAPQRVDPGQKFGLTVAVTAELSRQLFVTVKPKGGRGCEASYTLDAPVSDDVTDVTVQGAKSMPVTMTASRSAGSYLLCAYVQESSGDLAPEAAGQAVFRVGPDPCATAKTALTKATKAARTAKTATSRERATWKRYERAGRQAPARRAHTRYVAAVRRQAKAQATLTKAKKAATKACGK
jgi:hypothetical protein